MKVIKARIDEFVKYHIEGDGECNNVVLKEWAKNLSLQEKYELTYFFAITYSVPSAIILFKDKTNLFLNTEKWIIENKSKIIFQSDRKYIRMKDSFKRCLDYFKDNISNVNIFLNKTTVNNKIILNKAIPFVEKWELFGRFSAFLFLETFVELTDMPIENTVIDWSHGNTATSGLLNVFGYDKQAEIFDKNNKLNLSDVTMNKMLHLILTAIKNKNGDNNVTKVETSLCAYRKFYKGSRYNGYYLDRMLEEILTIQKDFPHVAQDLFKIRKENFDKKYLGEISGWNGIRKDMKKLYKMTGLIL